MLSNYEVMQFEKFGFLPALPIPSVPTPMEALEPLRQQFEVFTQRSEASKLPDEMKPSAVLIGYDPLLSQGTFRRTGDSHAIAQAMLVTLRDPTHEAFRLAFWEVINELV